jgi:2-dehydropantoate 2-reductase
MRIAIYGAGGVGGHFGARLALAGQDVTFIARGAHLRAIRDQGLRLESPAGEVVIKPAKATDDPADVGEVDAILVALKAWQVTEAAHAMRPMIGPDTAVVPLQNGVEAPSQLAAVLGVEHAMGGLCGTISMVVAPGRIRIIGGPGFTSFIRFGELDKSTERARQALAAGFREYAHQGRDLSRHPQGTVGEVPFRLVVRRDWLAHPCADRRDPYGGRHARPAGTLHAGSSRGRPGAQSGPGRIGRH